VPACEISHPLSHYSCLCKISFANSSHHRSWLRPAASQLTAKKSQFEGTGAGANFRIAIRHKPLTKKKQNGNFLLGNCRRNT
jgi:hypothetical protein